MLNAPLQGLSEKAVGLERVTQDRRELGTSFVGSQQVHGLKKWVSS